MVLERISAIMVKIPVIGYLFENKFVFALFLLLATAFFGKILLLIYDRIFTKLAKKTKTEVDDYIVERTRKPLFYLIITYGIKVIINYLGYNGILLKSVSTILALVFVFLLSRILDIILEVWGATFAKKTKTSFDDVVLPLFHKSSKVIFVIISLLWVLDIWGIDITPYLAGVGISGLVLGLALQDSLKNVFGGVSLILDKTFKVGDKVKLETGELGEIYDVGLRSTRIRTYGNEVIIIPNGQLANSRIQNYTKPTSKARVDVDVSVAYGSNIQEVKKVILSTIKNMEEVLGDPEPSANFVLMADFALQFKVYFWVGNWRNAWTKKLEATEKLYDALNKAKINIPFPTQTVYLKK